MYCEIQFQVNSKGFIKKLAILKDTFGVADCGMFIEDVPEFQVYRISPLLRLNCLYGEPCLNRDHPT
jgi:hypothetical protein